MRAERAKVEERTKRKMEKMLIKKEEKQRLEKEFEQRQQGNSVVSPYMASQRVLSVMHSPCLSAAAPQSVVGRRSGAMLTANASWKHTIEKKVPVKTSETVIQYWFAVDPLLTENWIIM